MIAHAHELQYVVTHRSVPSGARDAFLSRIASALEGIGGREETVGAADIAGLLRQAMLRHQFKYHDATQLRVPIADGWPNADMWRQFGCTPTPAGVGHLLVGPTIWKPDWLDPGAAEVVEHATLESVRRISRPVPSDPAATIFGGVSQYLSAGQREGVHAAYLSPPGSTTILSLPTGAGKTLVFQLPALTFAAEGGLAVVVVPTVALAKDQEERFRALARNAGIPLADNGIPLAYHGGLPQDAKQRLRAAIAHGETPIVFTSPEALLDTLRDAVFAAARQGRLKLLVIDEAHVVTQWGQNFRPEFQSMAGFKDALLAACPPDRRFRTLLLSATLSSESIDTLRALFGSAAMEVVTELALRPESAFLVSAVQAEHERTARVVQGLINLPRPLILYTTRRDDAQQWYVRLRDMGFRRLRLVRGGDLSTADGGQILADWHSNAIDMVVATSAFGLGIEHQGVRSVIHACLPETVDRFYQEVGRAGRDGNASVSLLVTTVVDVRTAEHLAAEQSISVERGFERWLAMWKHRRRISENTFAISLDRRPADIASPGEYNSSWNLRTLVLMARAGLVGFAVHSPDLARRDTETDGQFEVRRARELRQYASEVAVQVLDSEHSSVSRWQDRVGGVRSALARADLEGLRLLMELRDLRRPMNELFRQVYTLGNPPVRPPFFPGSCPVTRARGTVDFRAPEPQVTHMSQSNLALSASLWDALRPCLDDAGRAWISYSVPLDQRENRKWRGDVLRLLSFAVTGGIVDLRLPNDLLTALQWKTLLLQSPHRFLVAATDGSSSVNALRPRLTLVPNAVESTFIAGTMRVNASTHLILFPSDAPDPTRPPRRLIDLVRHLRLRELLAALES